MKFPFSRSFRFAAILLALFAFGLTQAPRPAQAEDAKLKLAVTLVAVYMTPYYAADEWGIYKDEGLKLEYSVVNGDQNALRAMISGSADVGTGIGPPVLFEAVDKGAQVKAIDSPLRITDYYLIMAKGKGSSLKDIVGKRVAISTPGGMPHLLPQMMLKKNGIDAGNTNFIPIGGMSARLQAIEADKVDASIVDTQTVLMGGDKVAVVASIPEQFPQGLAYGYTIVSDEALKNKDKRAALVKLNRGVIRASKMIYADPDKAAQVMYDKFQRTVDLELLKKVIRDLNKIKGWNDGQGVEKTVYDFTSQTYVDAKAVTAAVPYEKAVDNTIETEALKGVK